MKNSYPRIPLQLLTAFGGLILILVILSLAPFQGRNEKLYEKSQSEAKSPYNDGDVDGSLVVDIYDYNKLIQFFNQVYNDADFNDNGTVDIYDYNLVVSNFGRTYGSNPTSTPNPTPPTGGSLSMAMGKWTPNPSFDTCTKAQHDGYNVVGPDGKTYPTWHPPLGPSGCKFGHEHGRDPSQSLVWKQIKEYFYFDANHNGTMDPSEEAVSGLPFGYVNEQYDVYNASKGISGMRHEDHVGHKVDFANGEPDIATHVMSSDPVGGVWVGKNGNGVVVADTGVRCFYLSKAHQGVSTKDAFTNNIHEVFYFADCKHPNPVNNQKISVAMMEAFGAPGGFTSFMPLCHIERRSQPQDLVCPLGKDSTGKCIKDSVNQNYPSGNGDREIITRDCVEIGFLVPPNEFSGNFYEAWPASLSVVTPAGKNLVSGINLLFDVEDANRYYYPDALKTQRGYNNPAAGPDRGFSMDLCYENFNGRIAHGGPCEIATNYGAIKGIQWDDPRSAFKGIHRGMYFQPASIDNAGGPQYWYSDPFGFNAQTTPFPGSIKQQITPANLNYSSLINNQSIDPRVTDRIHSDGNRSVHAPN